MLGIELSAGMMTGLPQRVIRLNEYANSVSPTAAGMLAISQSNWYGNQSPGILQILKGAYPATIPIARATRAADVLIEFKAPNPSSPTGGTPPIYTTNDFAPSNVNTNPVTLHTIYKAAIASGTATWFMINQFMPAFDGNGNASGNWLGNAYLGTIGLLGSGADLEIASVDIVLGVPYRIRGLQLLFPSVWTY